MLDYLPDETAVILDEPEHLAHTFHRFREGLAQLETSRLNRGALLPTPHALYLPLPAGLQQLARFPEVAISLLPPGADASFTDPLVKSVELPRRPPSPPCPAPRFRRCSMVRWSTSTVRRRSTTPSSPINCRPIFSSGCATGTRWYGHPPGASPGGDVHRDGAARPSPARRHSQARSAAATGMIVVRRAEMGEGIIFPDARVALLTDGELLGWQKQRRSVRRHQSQGQALAEVGQLTPGDYVVHIHHGIGRYIGLVRREVQGTEREFLQIDYAGSDKLFVPVDQLDRVQKYLGLGEESPEVHRLGGAEWERIKRRTKKSTEELARQLLKLQALRSQQQGHAFSPDTPWQREMEEGFPWRETPDQLTAIEAVKWDMEQPTPTDRLICGNVGYGKTEVAIRAAFKAVMDGKQVAVLVPTTVLASQHYRTFQERMAAFPIRVALLSRTVPRREQTKTAAAVSEGTVDILIGTHRLLSQDVKFKDLGLVIVDEEQRFGVKQKERFKQMKADVDVLTMSATPIPRTLHMALSGLRELSLINTPPEGRMPVRTLAMEADDEVLREAILRELDRDGQVFVLHNRIASIYHVAEHLRQVVPQARVEVAHGQMEEGELDRIMMDFYPRQVRRAPVYRHHRKRPRRAERQHHHRRPGGYLRARAALSTARARGAQRPPGLCLFTWKARKKLTETAQERIAALKEFSSLGLRVQGGAARSGDPRGGQPAGRRTERGAGSGRL